MHILCHILAFINSKGEKNEFFLTCTKPIRLAKFQANSCGLIVFITVLIKIVQYIINLKVFNLYNTVEQMRH